MELELNIPDIDITRVSLLTILEVIAECFQQLTIIHLHSSASQSKIRTTMRFPTLTPIIAVILTSIAQTHALPQPSTDPPGETRNNTLNALLPEFVSSVVGDGDPPLKTSTHSPECLKINNGELMCCQSELNGGNRAVLFLASLVGYEVTRSSVNGIQCGQRYLSI